MELLERLAIKEVSIKIPTSSELLRLEADFYTSDFVAFKKSLLGSDIIDFVQYGTSEELNEENNGYPILRLNEFELNFIKTPTKFCNKITHETYESLKLYKNDVLICRTNGNPKLVGKSAIVQEDYEFAYASYLFKIRPKKELINSSTLVTFLNCKYGRMEIEKHSMVGNQANFSPAKFREINIPIFDKDLNLIIEKLTFESSILLKQSQNLYTQAESLLLQEIGLETDPLTSNELVTGSNPGAIINTNVKRFAASFGVTGRLDAEYYQKKYDVLEGKFDKFKRIKICDLVNYPVSSGTTPKAGGDAYTDYENGIPFVRAVDLQNGEVSVSNFNYIKPEIHNSILKRTKLKKNDVLLSIAGTVGRSAIFKHEFEANINQAVAILRFDESEILRLYMVLFFNSKIGQEFVSKYSRQGVQTNLNLEEIGNLKIPIIDYKKQKEIAQLIEESFTLKKQSEHLLEVAKKAVEIAIDESEEVAMEFINDNV